jgi:hypothetical protein
MLGNPRFDFRQRQRKIIFLFSKEKKNDIHSVIVYPRVKQPGREFEFPSRSSTEVNEWNYSSASLYGFTACTEKALCNTVIIITRYYSGMKMLYSKKHFFVECKIINVKNVESYFVVMTPTIE